MSDLLQWAGALGCLAAFGLSQRGVWQVDSYPYLLCNCLGGAGLSAAAILTSQWGFVVLEAAWALFAGWGITSRLRGRRVRVPVS